MRTKAVVSLCDRTGVMVEPWRQAGLPCVIVDIQHERGLNESPTLPGLWTLGVDVRELRSGELAPGWVPDPAIVFAFPPCTDLANSGARWFKDKGLRALIEALELVETCRDWCESSDAPWMLENPVGQLSTYWRKPDFIVNPCDFAGWADDPDAEAYTKKTCLWTGGGFRPPAPKPVEPILGSLMHFVPPGPDRADIRSVTPSGFARAVFNENYHLTVLPRPRRKT